MNSIVQKFYEKIEIFIADFAYTVVRVESKVGWNVGEWNTINCCHCTSLLITDHSFICGRFRKFIGQIGYLPWHQCTPHEYGNVQGALTVEYSCNWTSQLSKSSKDFEINKEKEVKEQPDHSALLKDTRNHRDLEHISKFDHKWLCNAFH